MIRLVIIKHETRQSTKFDQKKKATRQEEVKKSSGWVKVKVFFISLFLWFGKRRKIPLKKSFYRNWIKEFIVVLFFCAPEWRKTILWVLSLPIITIQSMKIYVIAIGKVLSVHKNRIIFHNTFIHHSHAFTAACHAPHFNHSLRHRRAFSQCRYFFSRGFFNWFRVIKIYAHKISEQTLML